jgi:hypothetical protein
MTSLFDKLVEAAEQRRPTRVLTDSIPQERFVPDAQRALAMMRGAVGAEAPSVMDPSRSAYDSAVSSTELADMLSNLVPGVGALKGGLSALKAGAGALPAMGGIIRRGGDPTLHLTHALSSQDPSEALQFIQQQKPTLTAPSVAISRHNPTPFGGNSPTLLMNPYSKVYDPRHNALYPRDAYTFRVKDAEQHLANPSKDVRLTEQAHPPESNRLAISTMPRFRSFEGYEKSPFGALNLGEFDEDASKLSKELTRDYQQWYYNKGHDLNIPNYAGTARLIKAAQLGDEEAQQILRGLRMLPSEYGELKVMRHVPVNRENVSAIMLPNDFQSTRAAKYKEQGERLGVPTGSFYELATPGIRSEIDERVALLGDAVRPFQSRILDLDITPTELRESLPPGVANSIDILALTQTATDPESIVKAIQFDTLKSRQNDILNALHVDPSQNYAEGGAVKTPRIPTRNTRFIDPEGESARGRSALEVLRGYAGAPSQASVMRPDEIGAYGQGESAAMAEAFIPGAAMAKMPLMGILSAIKRLRHGGTYIPGSRIRDVLYAAEDPAFASSYVEPNRMPGSQLVEFDAYLRKAAERELIEQRAKDLGIDNEYYTPASIFDRNLHDEYAVKKLIKSLTDDEYDHAILDDIPMGHAEGMKDTRATILFPNALTVKPKGEYAEGGIVHKTPGAFEIIREQLPQFWNEEAAGGMRGFTEGLRDIFGVGPESGRSVMQEPSERDRIRGLTSMAAPAVYAAPIAGPALRAAAAYPRTAGLASAYAFEDPSAAFMGPASILGAYSPEAEASRFTDSLKGIDKFLAAHGTPHIFPPVEGNPLGAFDMSKLGTGEGVQAFMSGHYLAGDPRISRAHYRDRLVNYMNEDLNRAYEKQVSDALFKQVEESARQHKMVPSQVTNLAKKVTKGKDFEKEYARRFDEEKLDNEWNEALNSAAWTGGINGVHHTAEPEKFSLDKNIPKGLKSLVDDVESAKTWDEFFTTENIEKINNQEKEIKKRQNIYGKIFNDARTKAYDIIYSNPENLKTGDTPGFESLHEDLIKKSIDALPAKQRAVLGDISDPNELYYGTTIQRFLSRTAKKRSEKGFVDKNKDEIKSAVEEAKKQAGDADQLYKENAKRGALYTVEVDASPGSMLPMNLPLKELKEDMPDVYSSFDQALRGLGQKSLVEYKGTDTPMHVWSSFPIEKSVALREELNARGVPGNLFLSSGNRSLNTDLDFNPSKFNYVIFNDEVPKIISRELGDVKPSFAEGGQVDFPNITPRAMLNRIVSAYNAL